jgi:hypothetical protein
MRAWLLLLLACLTLLSGILVGGRASTALSPTTTTAITRPAPGGRAWERARSTPDAHVPRPRPRPDANANADDRRASALVERARSRSRGSWAWDRGREIVRVGSRGEPSCARRLRDPVDQVNASRRRPAVVLWGGTPPTDFRNRL